MPNGAEHLAWIEHVGDPRNRPAQRVRCSCGYFSPVCSWGATAARLLLRHEEHAEDVGSPVARVVRRLTPGE